jgi:hypothetical protein
MTHSDSFDPRSLCVCNRRTIAGRAIGRGAARLATLGVLVAALVLTNQAQAVDGKVNASVPDPTAAALFQAGVDLLDAGNWKEACAKFEASMALYPAASTLLNIARCYDHEGKLALAWSAYQRALVINRETQGEERKKALDEVAKKGLTNIEPRLPRLKILTSGSTPAGLRVAQNGKDVPVALLGTVIPVDPGQQSVFAEAPGFEPFTQSVTVAEGELVEIRLDLEKSAPTAWAVTRGVPTWSWISGGAGILLLTGAAAFRVDQAFVEGRQLGICKGDVEQSCPAKSVYDPTADNSRKNLDNGLFIGLGTLGVIGLGAAIVGFVTGPPAKKPANKAAIVTPWIGPSVTGLGVGGRF